MDRGMDDLNRECCDICDVKFTSREHSNSHYEGKKHKKKTCDIYAFAASMKGSNHGNHRLQQNYCHYCKIQVSGPAPMKQHRESARHIKKVQETRSRQGSDADSSTSISPNGSTYNEFNIKPDSTEDIEDNHEHFSDYCAGPMTLQSNPVPNGVMPDQLKLQTAELAAKLNAMQLQDIKNQLMEPCKKLIQEELEKIVPFLAEKLVDMTMESVRMVGLQQEASRMKHSPGQENMVEDNGSNYGSFMTSSASSVCNQLFPSGFQTAPTSMNASGQFGMATASMNGHHSFAGPSLLSAAKVTHPPPGFDTVNRVTSSENQF